VEKKAVRRAESPRIMTSHVDPQLPLGQLLVEVGALSELALAEVLALQKTDPRRLGELLVEKELVQPKRLAQILSYQLSCPWISLAKVELTKSLIDWFPRELALKHSVVPVHLRTLRGVQSLYIATDDPTDEVALAECAHALSITVKPMIAVTFEIRLALSRYYGGRAPSLRKAAAATEPLALVAEGTTGQASPTLAKETNAREVTLKLAKPPVPVVVPAPPPVSKTEVRTTPETSTQNVLPPVVLVLNAPEPFYEQCEIAAKGAGATVENGSLLDAAERLASSRPAAIVVTDDVYAFDRSGLNRLAIENDALLVVWSEDVEAPQLLPLLEGAIKRLRRPTT
jgi:hypothetical protein